MLFCSDPSLTFLSVQSLNCLKNKKRKNENYHKHLGFTAYCSKAFHSWALQVNFSHQLQIQNLQIPPACSFTDAVLHSSVMMDTTEARPHSARSKKAAGMQTAPSNPSLCVMSHHVLLSELGSKIFNPCDHQHWQSSTITKPYCQETIAASIHTTTIVSPLLMAILVLHHTLFVE